MQKRIDTIRRIVAEVFGVEVGLLSDPGRSTKDHPSAAGNAYMYLIRCYTFSTYAEAARLAGRKDHSTARNAYYRFCSAESYGDPYHKLAKTAEQKVEEALFCDSSS